MRYIVVPADVPLVHPVSKAPLTENNVPVVKTFAGYALETWLDDQRVGVSPVRLRRWMEVIRRFEGTRPGDVILVEDQDWEGDGHDWPGLSGIVKDPRPRTHYLPMVAMQMLHFSDAVLEASTSPPGAVA